MLYQNSEILLSFNLIFYLHLSPNYSTQSIVNITSPTRGEGGGHWSVGDSGQGNTLFGVELAVEFLERGSGGGSASEI